MTTPGAPRLTGEMTINERIIAWRKYRGLTQETCAHLVGKSLSWWKKIEHGTRPIDRLSELIPIAKMLRVRSLDDLTGPLDVPLNQDRTDYHTLLPRVATAIQAVHSPSALPDEPPDLDNLRQRFTRALELNAGTRHITAVGQVLPELLLDSAHASTLSADASTRRRAARIESRVNVLASTWLRHVAALNLAAIVADRALALSRDADDPMTFALASWQEAGVNKDQGQAEKALDRCYEALRLLEPTLDASSDENLSVYGHLQLQAGLSAGHCGDQGAAMRAWDTGEAVSKRLGSSYLHPHTCFCAAAVGVFHLRTWAALGNARQVVATADRFDIQTMPEASARALAWIDTSHNYVANNDDVAALRFLEIAYQNSPELVSHNASVREDLRTMMLRDRKTITRDLHEMARRVGIFT